MSIASSWINPKQTRPASWTREEERKQTPEERLSYPGCKQGTKEVPEVARPVWWPALHSSRFGGSKARHVQTNGRTEVCGTEAQLQGGKRAGFVVHSYYLFIGGEVGGLNHDTRSLTSYSVYHTEHFSRR